MKARCLSLSLLVGVSCLLSPVEARPYFNDLVAPQNLDDLLRIQETLQETLVKVRPATVCLKIGEGSGSGVIVSPDGLVLTAAHVSMSVGEEIVVVLEDGTEIEAVGLGLNAATDASMVQLLGEGPFPYVEMEKSDETKLGDWVVSLGHSGGFDQARGVVVRLGRLVRKAQSTVQSDCSLIGGDSGGPLFDIEGRLIGIHSRVGRPKSESMHVPLKAFRDHWDALLDSQFVGEGPFAEKPQKGSGFLGLGSEEVEGGLRVTRILEGSTAEKLGLALEDVVVSLNGETFANKEAFQALLVELAKGDEVTMAWQRGEESMEGKARLGQRD